MQITVNEKGKLVYLDDSGENAIHHVHCSEVLEDLFDDVCEPYIVFQQCTNFPFVHLVTDFSEDEALQQVATYLTENAIADEDEESEDEETESYQLISVHEAELLRAFVCFDCGEKKKRYRNDLCEPCYRWHTDA
jgi:hypothetical protein